MDALSTVRYIMGDAVGSDLANAPNPEKLSRMGSSTLNLSDIKDPHVALKSEISHILDAKAVELAAGAKGKKKDEAPVGETDYSGDALTEELCACLPTLLVRECVLMRINTDPKCIKKGYVLDVWKRLFSNLVEYLEMTLGHRPGQSEEPKEDSEDTEPSQKMQELYLAGGTALVVEIQVQYAGQLTYPGTCITKTVCFVSDGQCRSVATIRSICWNRPDQSEAIKGNAA